MSNSISIDVQGLSELEQALAELGNAVAGQVLYDALMKGAEPIKQEAMLAAPRSAVPHYRYSGKKDNRNKRQIEPGNLKRKIKSKRLKAKKHLVLTGGNAFVGVFWSGDAFYGRFVEFGTKNMAAKPFLRPAFIQRQNDALDIIKQRLAANIERARRKAAARTGGQ